MSLPRVLVEMLRGGDGTRSAATGSGYAPQDPITVLNVFFDNRSSIVSKNERRKVIKFAKSVSGQGFETMILIGHTDGRGELSSASRLSSQRTKAVVQILNKHADVKFVQRIMGAKRPIASNSTPAGQAKNRRVQIQLR